MHAQVFVDLSVLKLSAKTMDNCLHYSSDFYTAQYILYLCFMFILIDSLE